MTGVLIGLGVLILLVLFAITLQLGTLIERTKLIPEIDDRLQVCETYLANLVDEFANDFPTLGPSMGSATIMPIDPKTLTSDDISQLQRWFTDAIEMTQWDPSKDEDEDDESEDGDQKPWLK